MGEERLQGLEEVGARRLQEDQDSCRSRLTFVHDRLGKDRTQFGLGAGVVLVYPLLECVDFPLQLCVD